jgi:hypothetical protein
MNSARGLIPTLKSQDPYPSMKPPFESGAGVSEFNMMPINSCGDEKAVLPIA